MVNGQGGTSVYAYWTSLSGDARPGAQGGGVAVWATSDARKEPAVKKVVPNRDDRLRRDWLSGLHCHAVSRTAMGGSFTSNGSVPLRFVEGDQA